MCSSLTSQGSPYSRFCRAVKGGNPNLALEAAGELRAVSLTDALNLCRLLARAQDRRFEAAARRWLGRFGGEAHPTLEELMIAGAAMARLGREPESAMAYEILERLAARATSPR